MRCTASLQLRTAIALCIFIVIATIPLQIIGIKEKPTFIFKAPIDKQGKQVQNCFYFKQDHVKKHLDMRYQNHLAFPAQALDQLHARITLSKDKHQTIIIPPTSITLNVSSQNKSVLNIIAQSDEIFPTLPADKKELSRSEQTAYVLSKRIKLDGYKMELLLTHKDAIRAVIKGDITQRQHHLRDVSVIRP